jgi:hypothetical protein
MMGRTQLIFVVVLTAIVAIAVGIALRMLREAPSQVVLEPNSIEIIREPLENQMVTVHLQLRNQGRTPITLTYVGASCGCMKVITRGNVPVLPGIQVPAGGDLPIEVLIDTTGKRGLADQTISVQSKAGQQTFTNLSRIAMNVRAGWLAIPSILLFDELDPEKNATQKITIVDAFPDPGIEIASCESSTPDRVFAEFEQIDSVDGAISSGDRQIDIDAAQKGLRRRYVLTVYCPKRSQAIVNSCVRRNLDQAACWRIPSVKIFPSRSRTIW